MSKVCNGCEETKSVQEFRKGSGKCKLCIAAYAKQYHTKNKETIAAQRQCRADYNEVLAAKRQQYLQENPFSKTCNGCGEKKAMDKFGKGSGKCKLCIAAQQKQWRADNREAIAARQKQYQKDNKEAIAAKAKHLT